MEFFIKKNFDELIFNEYVEGIFQEWQSFSENNSFPENFVDTPPLSPSSECYRQKLVHLKEKFSLVQENTNRLRSRLYNIKKVDFIIFNLDSLYFQEISNMKRLKRVLINKLVGHGDEFYNLPLEIPDDRYFKD